MTTPKPHRDVPLPPDAIADAGGWVAGDNQFRVIFTPDVVVPGTDVHVYGRAHQLPDGTLDPEHPPLVAIDECWLSIDQARAAAAMILAAADMLERWVYHHLESAARAIACEFGRDTSPESLADLARLLGKRMQGDPALAGAVSRLLASDANASVVADSEVGR
ncbi:hypothetical protein PR371_00645 [Mycobacterium marinum]|uniref:hypothetical protein n=1 Tax=Mycobacterium marinum TaxID=1781 RepID=UPI002341C263|nr:hypothetical protein [Mycobacterium marinum]MDC8992488.1 hypothetical protein [Mycobacterium marinum]WDZ15789.1 hypothetical protein PQR73_009680 [Mycobacterium marinum]